MPRVTKNGETEIFHGARYFLPVNGTGKDRRWAAMNEALTGDTRQLNIPAIS